ncbi:MAG: bifunctional oligoribonuclease/PAP phosphatase NrnA [Desulfomonilaceae bacterium]
MNREISRILQNEDKFLVVTHVNPDGDAVGSLLGTYLALSEMGKQAWPFSGEKFPGQYDFLRGIDALITTPDEIDDTPAWIIALDVAEERRISGDIKRFREKAKLINIDHHPTNPGFGDLNYVKSTATATAELVHELLRGADYKISADVGKCLYTGLITDTGCFRFSGVNSTTLQIGAEMLEPGFDSYQVTRHLFEEFPLGRLFLERLMLERIEVLLEGRLVLSTLSHSDYERLGLALSEGENLVNRLRESRGVEAGVLVTQTGSDVIRVSFRSKDRLDVSLIAKSLGGGGHSHAAGLKSTLPLPHLKEKIIRAIEDALA